MQLDYLTRLSPAARTFVQQVEAEADVGIEVELDEKLNGRGSLGQGQLKIDIEAQSVRLYAPTNGYFPDGAVRHEVLHVRRLLVEGVPRIALADAVDVPPPGFESSLVGIDNSLEHLVIVPVELHHHPERREHWERVMARVWKRDLPNAAYDLDRRIGTCLHWTFLLHVLPDSPVVQVAEAYLQGQGSMQTEANDFAAQAVAFLGDKAGLVRRFFDGFHELPKDKVALEYLNRVTGTKQEVL